MTAAGLAGKAAGHRARTVAVASVGLLFVAAAFTGTGGQVVRPWFLPVLGVAGALIVACAASVARQSTSTMALVVLLPLAAWLGVAGQQPAVSAAPLVAISADGGPQQRFGDRPNPLLSGPGGAVDILQVLVATSELGPAALDGKHVELTAVSDGSGSVSRLAMVCCIADARRVRLRVEGSLPRKGQWVRVTGELRAGDSEIVLVAQRIQATRPPSRPVL
jgi:hypothetical protein